MIERKRKVPFATWEEVLDAVDAGEPLYYQAPMDAHPQPVSAIRKMRGGKALQTLRVSRWYGWQDFDPFNADSGHLGRFRHVVRVEGR